MPTISLGIIGCGNMGRGHIQWVLDGSTKGFELKAICDSDTQAMKDLAPGVAEFTDPSALIQSGTVEAILIATPHFSHHIIAIEALQAGLHVMIEKPIAAQLSDAQAIIAEHKKHPHLTVGVMFQQRTRPVVQKIRKLLADGALGTVQRYVCSATNWFRTDQYYSSGGWRASWGGEGGGVLINQCPHALDALWWLFGDPEKVWAECEFGKWHDIEVEDDVTAKLSYPTGMNGVFIASTGESPGRSRLEISGTKGLLIMEEGLNSLRFIQNEDPSDVALRTLKGKPETWETIIPIKGKPGGHAAMMTNFAGAIRGKEDLIAPLTDGLGSLQLANAMLLSTWKKSQVELPLNAQEYESFLSPLRADSRFDPQAIEQPRSYDLPTPA